MAILNIGDKVIYVSQGIMKLVDCRQEPIGDEMKLYYVLSGAETATEALTFVPTDSERLTALIKPLLSREALGEQLSGFDKSTLPEWLESSRARQEAFRKVLELGNRRDVLGVVLLLDG